MAINDSVASTTNEKICLKLLFNKCDNVETNSERALTLLIFASFPELEKSLDVKVYCNLRC